MNIHMNKRAFILMFDVFINALLPILIGVFIYRLSFENEYSIIKNYAPDALWAYALASSIFIIWSRKMNYFWLLIVIIFFVVFEILQYLHFVKGTGDVWDVLTYLIATFIAIIINKFVKLYFYKTNTTL
jgi:hypothetical protein